MLTTKRQVRHKIFTLLSEQDLSTNELLSEIKTNGRLEVTPNRLTKFVRAEGGQYNKETRRWQLRPKV